MSFEIAEGFASNAVELPKCNGDEHSIVPSGPAACGHLFHDCHAYGQLTLTVERFVLVADAAASSSPSLYRSR